MSDTISGETITYQYDALKRLTQASSSPIGGTTPASYTMNYSYDVFGNLTQNEQGNPITVNPATNQVSCTPSCYDLNGNMTSGANATMTYDSNNRMVSAVVSGGGAEYYDYAPDGKRIYRESVNGAQSTEYWTFYGARGEKLGVFSFGLVYNQGLGTYQFTALMSDIQFAGKTIVNNGATMMQDRLGTNRVGGARLYDIDTVQVSGN